MPQVEQMCERAPPARMLLPLLERRRDDGEDAVATALLLLLLLLLPLGAAVVELAAMLKSVRARRVESTVRMRL
jgi:hypothetical protein